MSILKLNSTQPGVRRPLRVEDIQNVWDGLAQAFTGGIPTDQPRIICGFELAGLAYGPGVIAYQGKLYVSASNVSIGQRLYGDLAPSNDIRTLSDGTQIDFSSQYVVTTTATATSVLIGSVSPANINLWSAPRIPGRYITESMLDSSSVNNRVIAYGAVNNKSLDPSLAACYVSGIANVNIDNTSTILLHNYLKSSTTTAGAFEIPAFNLNSSGTSGSISVTLKLEPASLAFPRFVPIVLVNPNDGPEISITFSSNGNDYVQMEHILDQGGRGCFTVCKIAQTEYIPCGAMVTN